MKICHVCQAQCEDEAKLCHICGADITTEHLEEIEEAKNKQTEKEDELLLLASMEDVISSEIFKDILTDNGIEYFSNSPLGEGAIRITFGGEFTVEEIFVRSSDYAIAEQLYEEFANMEFSFEDEGIDQED